MKEKYLVQTILVEETYTSTLETVVESIKTNDYAQILHFLMRKHKTSNKYLYTVMNLETDSLIYKSKRNLHSCGIKWKDV